MGLPQVIFTPTLTGFSTLNPQPYALNITDTRSPQPHTLNPNPRTLTSPYRGTSLLRNTPLPGPHSRTIPRVLWWS